jgi:hypothetical protein
VNGTGEARPTHKEKETKYNSVIARIDGTTQAYSTKPDTRAVFSLTRSPFLPDLFPASSVRMVARFALPDTAAASTALALAFRPKLPV